MPAAAYQANCALSLDAVHDYFAQLNPIAQRIACDIKQTQSTYGHLWCTLSAHEQNDIINETLIKPEIALRYFDNFSSNGSSSSGSRSDSGSPTLSSVSANSNMRILAQQQQCRTTTAASAESLITAVLKSTPQLCPGVKAGKLKPPNEPPPPPPVRRSSQSNIATSCYAYDGRHLRTYTLQKVALKFVQDEALGMYRDEHAAPFSYRTKSQIDLPQQCITPISDNELFLLPCTRPTRNTLSNCKKLQQELKQNLNTQLRPAVAAFKSANVASSVTTATAIPAVSLPINKPTLMLENKMTACAVMEKKSSYNSSKTLNYGVYADGYYEQGEHVNLMAHSCNLAASSSSTNTSDDEDNQRYADDDDEKTLCEDVKLLDKDTSLRKGFDFLNNW